MPPRPALSVVVPCFNEAQNLHELARRTTAACREAVGDDYEIILINDGSRDSSWSVMGMLADEDRHVVSVNLSRNYGHQIALSAGLEISRGDRVLILDADLQDPPELLGQMMALMDQGNDIVYGLRTARHGESWFKRIAAALFYRCLRRLVDIEIPLDAGDFRLMSRRAVDIINKMPERNRFLRGMASWIGLKQAPLPYERATRFAGTTSYPLSKMLRLAVDAVTSFSIVPMRMASYVGVTLGIAGIVMLIYVLGAWFSGQTVQGWTSLMVIVLVIGSAQLVSLGVFGEYLGRLYMEAKQRPLYVVDEVRSEGRKRTSDVRQDSF